MKRIFPNLYRLTEADGDAWAHSYLIVRKSGNLLLPGYVPSLVEHLDLMEKLGGVSLQFLTHVHDVNAEFHDQAFTRFDSKLCHHKAARSRVQQKTECPAEEFGHDGLALDDDFEATYFPGHTPGHSIFRWHSGGKQFLFTGHVMRFEDDRWKLNFNPTKAPKGTDFDHLAKSDYLLPSYSRAEDYSTMDGHSRALFLDAITEAWKYPRPVDRDVF
jgi:glyoxylase-like metal-dependent hydrolase (beta-lactamase superfamily II)